MAVIYANLTEFASLITGIPVSGTMFKAQIDQLIALLAASRNGDRSATKEAKALVLVIRENFALDAAFIENLINTTSPPSLATKLGFVLGKIRGRLVRVAFTVVNTNILGQVLVTITAIKNAYFYKVEFCLIAADGTPGVLQYAELTNVTGFIDDLESGAKYSFRIHAVYRNNSVGAWSASVLLRIS